VNSVCVSGLHGARRSRQRTGLKPYFPASREFRGNFYSRERSEPFGDPSQPQKCARPLHNSRA
jgi:hypothetical protein